MTAWIETLDSRLVTLVASLLGAGALALAARWILLPLLTRLARTSASDLDDALVARIRGPLMLSIMLLGLGWGMRWLEEGTLRILVFGLIWTLAVVMWSVVIAGGGVLVLNALSRRGRAIQPKTLPLFVMIWKIVVYGAAAYFLLAAWHIDVTTWLASAGVAGIAVGFAAKDTLANLFSGVFIIADAPFKIGDYIVIDGELRGEVTEIGLRSSRILTRDDVEVTVPNAVIGNAKIVNETGGPRTALRARIKVMVAYGSDVESVRAALLAAVDGVPHVLSAPEPRVRLRELADAGLRFELLAWVASPELRGRVSDALNVRVYEGLREAGIEIPYPQLDLRVRELPR